MDQNAKAQSSPAPATSGTKRAENNTTNDSERAKKKPTSVGSEEEMEASDQSSPAPATSGTKRTATENNTAAENNTANDSKRAKNKPTTASSEEEMEASDDVKKSNEDSRKLFQRLWSDEDEVTILKGLTLFALKTGSDPTKNVTTFYDFVSKSLVFDASINQLKFKIRRFRDKFKVNAERAKNQGEDPVFPKPHDQELYELSKRFWGEQGVHEKVKKLLPNGKVAASSKKKPAPAKKLVVDAKEEEKENLVALKETGKEVVGESSSILIEMYPLNGMNEMAVKRGLELIGESEKAELEEKWKKLRIDEMELLVNRARLIEEQTRLILEAYKASGGGSGGH